MKYIKLFEDIFEEDWEELSPDDEDIIGKIGEDININVLEGQTLKDIKVSKVSDEDIIKFITIRGIEYIMYHQYDCCESVTIEDINGDLNDLIGVPILNSREDKDVDDATWTFYNISTIKGHVNIRWYGTSNGNYSEEVIFERVK